MPKYISKDFRNVYFFPTSSLELALFLPGSFGELKPSCSILNDCACLAVSVLLISFCVPRQVISASDFSLCHKVSKTAVKRSRCQGTLNFISKNTIFGRLIDLLHVDLTSLLGIFQTSCCCRYIQVRLYSGIYLVAQDWLFIAGLFRL